MKVFKKAATLLLAATMLLSAASCSSNSTWSVKTDAETLPIGVYIYNTYNAYQEAYSKTLDTSSSSTSSTVDVLSKTIEEKSATEWIEKRALELCKLNLVVNQKFKDMNLFFTDEESKTIQTQTDSAWSQSKTFLEELGIAKDSFTTAYSWQSARSSKIFNAIYGKDGTNAVPDTDLEKYLTDNYTHFGWFSKALTTTDAEGNSNNMSDEEIAEVETQFKAYAEQINSGEKKITDVSAAYTSDEALESNPYSDRVEQLDKSTLSDEMKTAIKGVENGKAVAFKSGNYYYMIYKYDIKDSVSQLSTDSFRLDILSDMKSEEFTQMMTDEANKLAVQTNDSLLKGYGPSRIESAVNKK